MKIFNSINDVRNWVDGFFQNSMSADQIARAAVAVDSLARRQGIAFGQDWEPVLKSIKIEQLEQWSEAPMKAAMLSNIANIENEIFDSDDSKTSPEGGGA